MECTSSTSTAKATAVLLLMMFRFVGCDSSPTSSTADPDRTFETTPEPALTPRLACTFAQGAALRTLRSDGTEGIRVLVKETGSATEVTNGTFELVELPVDSFTLEFTDATRGVVGSLSFDNVQTDHRITITVELRDGEVVLLEERREDASGPIDAGAEVTRSPFAGRISGTWGGVCDAESIGGAFTMTIASNGSVSGSYTGGEPGTIRGLVANGGAVSIKASGSAGECSWFGSLRRTSGNATTGNGSWSCPDACQGTWTGSGS